MRTVILAKPYREEGEGLFVGDVREGGVWCGAKSARGISGSQGHGSVGIRSLSGWGNSNGD